MYEEMRYLTITYGEQSVLTIFYKFSKAIFFTGQETVNFILSFVISTERTYQFRYVQNCYICAICSVSQLERIVLTFLRIRVSSTFVSL